MSALNDRSSCARACGSALCTWALALAGVVMLGAQAPAASATPLDAAVPVAPEEAFDEALQIYERNHWLQAFDAFRRLAGQGHAGAARMVVQMHQHGPRLYGQHFALSVDEQDAFSRHHRLATTVLKASTHRQSAAPCH
jgi:hypothetical protein